MAISFCVPTYNRLPLIKRTIETIRNGIDKYTYEIIVADGGSTDGTIKYLKKQKDVVLIEQKKLLGAVKAYNACFKKVKYEYVFWPNDDFILQINVIIKACDLMDKYPEVGAVSPKFIELKNFKFPNIGFWNEKIILSKTHIFRTSVLKENKYFDENYRTYTVDIDSHLAVLCSGYVTLFTRELGAIHSRLDDEVRQNNIKMNVELVESETRYFRFKYEEINRRLTLNLSISNKIRVYIFYRLRTLLRNNKFMKYFMDKNNIIATNLYDWVLNKCIIFKADKFNQMKDFYLGQKLPSSVVKYYQESSN